MTHQPASEAERFRIITILSALSRYHGFALATAATFGILLTFSFAPYFQWPFGFVGLIVLYGLVRNAATVRHALALGSVFGLAFFGTGASWVYIALSKQSSMYVIPAALSTLIFIGYLALFVAGACGITRWLIKDRISSWISGALFASIWVVGELLRGTLFGGFTSQDIGYLQIDGPLAGFAPVVGTYGLSWLSVFISALAFHAIGRKENRLPHLLSIAGVALAAWGLSFVTWTQPFGQPLSVRLLQPNIDPAIKSSPDKFPAALQHYRSLIIAKRADLIVTPETVFPLFWHELPPSYLDGLKHFAQTSGSNILLGVASVQDGQHATNNVVGILADGGASFPRYEKFHLMPFGEYTPVGFGWFSNHPNSSQRDLTAGDWSQPSMAVGVQRLGFMICHEEMFGEEALRWLPEATILVNPSNLAWFINSLASSQMLQIVRMRAVETGRPVLRTPNTGITAIIDHHGKVTASLPPSVSGVLEGTVQGMQGRTPYSSLGNLPVLGIIFLTFFLCAIPSIRKRRSVLSR